MVAGFKGLPHLIGGQSQEHRKIQRAAISSILAEHLGRAR